MYSHTRVLSNGPPFYEYHIVIHCDYDIFGNIMYSDAMYIHNENNSSNLHNSNFVP